MNIETFGKLHSELKELTEDIARFFTLPILLAVIANFMEAVTYVYLIYLYIVNNANEWKSGDIFMNGTILLWPFCDFLEFFFLSLVSAIITDEVLFNKNNKMIFESKYLKTLFSVEYIKY